MTQVGGSRKVPPALAHKAGPHVQELMIGIEEDLLKPATARDEYSVIVNLVGIDLTRREKW